MKWLFMAFLNYAKFSGRATRREFWGFHFLDVIMIFVCLCVDISSAGYENLTPFSFQATFLWFVFTFIPLLAVAVRRLHDINKSGAWYFVLFVPVLGFIIFYMFSLLPGTKGSNHYGSDPRSIFSNSF
ncbi:DUF805 domain-containing protein [Grimontia sp. S25]|uniref:DUF805 domain-containing protein n=1 Tax=Grimontia sedimenti TaxID=2711294 RepID=A0A6M1RLE1_9GAMM|nr:DUF805 domain-containing protein [Grimontia sedimenti]NGN98981.1 DUF805 domain-containing protein [Grimontia sedimenti]